MPVLLLCLLWKTPGQRRAQCGPSRHLSEKCPQGRSSASSAPREEISGLDPPLGGLHITRHARRRMQQRHITAAAVDAAFAYGRVVHTRGAVILAIGRNEARWDESGIDLSGFAGVQVVCSPDGTVCTVYRNRNFRRLRRGLGRRGNNRNRNACPSGT
jgi:hypothetical protein